MILRNNYLGKSLQLPKKQLIKVVTGIRRCGKSMLLELHQNYSQSDGVAPEQIISYHII